MSENERGLPDFFSIILRAPQPKKLCSGGKLRHMASRKQQDNSPTTSEVRSVAERN